MTNEEAKEIIIKERDSLKANPIVKVEDCLYEALDMAIKALEQTRWIPVKWHEITEEEREREGYPAEWVCYLDCIMPDDGQRILITTKGGYVELDECYSDDGCTFSLDSGYDWIDDVTAWMPLPQPYKDEVRNTLQRMYDKGYHDGVEAYKAMMDLEKEEKEEPAEDCISREAIDEYITNLLSGYLYDEERTRLEDLSAFVWELPSVTPKAESEDKE